MSTLLPALSSDIIVVELPSLCKEFSKDVFNEPIDAVYDTLTPAKLAAKRPRGIAVRGAFIPINGVPLTPYLTLMNDNGAELTIMTGQTQLTQSFGANYDIFCTEYENCPEFWVPGLAPVATCADSAQFVSSVCGAEGFSRCRTVVGTQPATCRGAFSTIQSPGLVNGGTLASACRTLCDEETNPATNAACRNVQVQACSGPDADDKPECACYRLNTSRVPVSLVAGHPMTYPETLQWFTDNFGGGGLPAMLEGLPCVFPSCKAPDAGLLAYSPCPVVQDCLALVKGVSATNDSHLKLTLKNACGITQTTDGADAPAVPPPAPDPFAGAVTAKQFTYVALIVIVTVLLALGMGVGALYGKRAIVRARVARSA